MRDYTRSEVWEELDPEERESVPPNKRPRMPARLGQYVDQPKEGDDA